MTQLSGNFNVDMYNSTMDKLAGITSALAPMAPLSVMTPLVGGTIGALGGALAERAREEDERNYIGAAINGFLHGGVGSLASRGMGLQSNIGNAILGGLYGIGNSISNTPDQTDIAYSVLKDINSFNGMEDKFKDDPEMLALIDSARKGQLHNVDPDEARQRVLNKISF